MAIATSAAAILVFPVAGCGGDDSTIQSVSTTASSTTTAVATDEFITAADARCAEANAAIANLSTDPAASSTAVDQQLGITKQTLSGLQALGDPEDPDGSLSDFYSAMQAQISALKKQQSALASGDTATYDSLGVELGQAQSDAETAATAFGLKECGQQGSAISSSGTSTSTTPSSGAVTPTTTTPAPTPTTPVAPVTPVTPPPTGGTGGGTGTGAPPATGGGGSSGGISPSG